MIRTNSVTNGKDGEFEASNYTEKFLACGWSHLIITYIPGTVEDSDNAGFITIKDWLALIFSLLTEEKRERSSLQAIGCV